MDIQESLQSTIHRIDGEHFLEEIYHEFLISDTGSSYPRKGDKNCFLYTLFLLPF